VIVVADTSVLVNLCRVGQGELFGRLFGEVIVPPEVANEFVRLVSSVQKFTGLSLPIAVRQQAATSVPPLLQTATGLDPGEFAALALAVEIHADAV
jgi:predicted nucleic acid-binding protein